MFDKGTGPPVIVIPGVQGRWEWMRPTVEAMSARCRTITYSLAGERAADVPFDAGFESYMVQLDRVFDRAGIGRAALCGVSYGGAIALRYAATRPERVSSLILAYAIAPRWRPNERQQRYIRRPWLSTAEFVSTAPSRLMPEICAALDGWGARLTFSAGHVVRLLMAPTRPSRMAARVTAQQSIDFGPDCDRVTAPTLVITGEPHLDRVVPVETTRQYVSLIRGARYEMMERSGHIGLVTRPEKFSEIVCGFVHANHH